MLDMLFVIFLDTSPGTQGYGPCGWETAAYSIMGVWRWHRYPDTLDHNPSKISSEL